MLQRYSYKGKALTVLSTKELMCGPPPRTAKNRFFAGFYEIVSFYHFSIRISLKNIFRNFLNFYKENYIVNNPIKTHCNTAGSISTAGSFSTAVTSKSVILFLFYSKNSSCLVVKDSHFCLVYGDVF